VGFCALFATSTGGIHTHAGSQSRASVRPRRFARPRRFSPPPAFRVCFTPVPRPGFPFRGLSLAAEQDRLSPTRCPPAVGPIRLRCDPHRKTDRRLQGLAPRAECGGLEGGLDPRNSAPLVGVSSFGFSPCPPSQRFRAASACGLHRIEPDARDPGRLAGVQVGWRGITLPTRSRFLT